MSYGTPGHRTRSDFLQTVAHTLGKQVPSQVEKIAEFLSQSGCLVLLLIIELLIYPGTR